MNALLLHPPEGQLFVNKINAFPITIPLPFLCSKKWAHLPVPFGDFTNQYSQRNGDGLVTKQWT